MDKLNKKANEKMLEDNYKNEMHKKLVNSMKKFEDGHIFVDYKHAYKELYTYIFYYKMDSEYESKNKHCAKINCDDLLTIMDELFTKNCYTYDVYLGLEKINNYICKPIECQLTYNTKPTAEQKMKQNLYIRE